MKEIFTYRILMPLVLLFATSGSSMACALCDPNGTGPQNSINIQVSMVYCCSNDTIIGVNVLCQDLKVQSATVGDSCSWSFGTDGAYLADAAVTSAEVLDSGTAVAYAGFGPWTPVGSPLWQSLLGTTNTFSYVSEVDVLGLTQDDPVEVSISFAFFSRYPASDSSLILDEIINGIFGMADWVNANPDTSTGGQLSICEPIALPVELAYFEGRHIPQEGNHLLWASWMELNFDYYSVQRSVEGGSFVEIGQVYGQGSENGKFEYEYIDRDIEVITGSIEYRLMNVDKNGEVTFSKVISLEPHLQKPLQTVDIYPVPASDRVNVGFLAFEQELLHIQIFDLQGRLLLEEEMVCKVGYNNCEFDLNPLRPGTYALSAKGPGGTVRKLFTKI